jgi:hypothetical protein
MSITNLAPLFRAKHWLRLTLTVCSPTLVCSAPAQVKMSSDTRHEAVAARDNSRRHFMLR